ncbi:TonB-dependent receptor [Prevotella sp. 10(H)]|uniref:TonB-dependent receptor n=1 Tax=Prevotella sp. 10(H) TaxID=1158294 RepID=UPI001E5A44D3|nr:TonB-dependent receptor [Prevotella sp. 10(H)]
MTAQSQTVNITGTVFDDATKEGIELASIRVMNQKDSAYVTGAATNATGKFSVAVKPGNYLVHVSFLGYVEQYFNVNTREKRTIGDVYLKEDGILLGEAVVEAKAPEIIIKGDTTEYNADSYKVQESAVLEDLIKKIPGAEIDADGKITVNGKDITKILVDGKEFFSDDPKTASQNLPAKMVEKLQVLDKKSDMAQLTGFDDGEEQTVINLVVKPDMKQGTLANLLTGYGNKDRYEGNGFVNHARGDTRISVLGNINNNNNENANSRGGGRGLTETKEVGLNIASETSEKFKFDGDIYYSHTDNDLTSTTSREYSSRNMTENGMSESNNKNGRFRSRFRFEWTPDTLTKIIFTPNISFNKTDNSSLSTSLRENFDAPNQNMSSTSTSSSDGNTFSLNGNLLINRKLNNKGRSITFELSGGLSDGDTDGTNYSLTDYVNTGEQKLLDQISDQKNNSNNWRARVSYLEPIGRGNFLELAYNIRNNHSETDKKTYENDGTGNYNKVAEDYTRNTQNDFLNQNISLSFQARRQKYNYTIGAGLEPSSSKTKVTQPNMEERNDPRRNFLNFAPRMEFNYLWDRRHNLRIRYDGSTSQASTNQLYDGIISQNATDTTRGNPNLKPSFRHNVNLRYQKYIPENASSIMAFARFQYITNDIVSVSSWADNGGRTSTYENISGNMNGFFRFMYNTPLKNKSFSINTGTFGNYTRDNTFISSKDTDPQKNTANIYRIGEDLRLKFNSDKLQFNIGGNITYEDTKHSLSKDRNQAIYNYGGFGDFTWYLPYNFTLESNLNYSSNSGYESGYQQNSWLWNASLSKQFNISFNSGDSKTTLPTTLRFKIYDILQDRSNISRSSNAESITYSTTNTITSYFMVNLIIRFQSFKGGAKRADMPEEGGRRYGPPGGGPPGGGRRGGGPMF